MSKYETLNESQFADLFAQPSETGNNPVDSQRSMFGSQQMDADILGSNIIPDNKVIDNTNPITPVEGTPPVEGVKELKEGEDVDEGASDILADVDGKKTPGRKPKYEFSDMSGYFEDRIKNGKFVAINDENDKGEQIPFIPKTPEEFDEVIDIQVNWKLGQKEKEVEAKFYNEKTPAWKAVMKYAEVVTDPTEMLPFLQGVRNIQSVANIDESQIEGAEEIIRFRLQSLGEPEDLIEDQIESLKTTNKLIGTATKYKPILIQQEQQNLGRLQKQKEDQAREYMAEIEDIRTKAINVIEQPLYGKTKLKQEEKVAVFDLIGAPSREEGGYKIFSAIDQLFDKNDFETLREVALLLSNKESFYNYLAVKEEGRISNNLQRKLKVANESKGSTSNDYYEESRPIVNRKQFTQNGGFGRR